MWWGVKIISQAKESYYLRAKDLRTSQPEKWYKTIYGLATINDFPNCIPPADVTEYLSEQLQQAFNRPWQKHLSYWCSRFPDCFASPEIYPSSLAIHYTSKMHNESLNLKKLTSANGVPAWLLKCFNDELDLVVHNIMSQASFNASIQNHINMQ